MTFGLGSRKNSVISLGRANLEQKAAVSVTINQACPPLLEPAGPQNEGQTFRHLPHSLLSTLVEVITTGGARCRPTMRRCGPAAPAGTAWAGVGPAPLPPPLPVQPSPPPLRGLSVSTAWRTLAAWLEEASVSEVPGPPRRHTATSGPSKQTRRSPSCLLPPHSLCTLLAPCSRATLCPGEIVAPSPWNCLTCCKCHRTRRCRPTTCCPLWSSMPTRGRRASLEGWLSAEAVGSSAWVASGTCTKTVMERLRCLSCSSPVPDTLTNKRRFTWRLTSSPRSTPASRTRRTWTTISTMYVHFHRMWEELGKSLGS